MAREISQAHAQTKTPRAQDPRHHGVSEATVQRCTLELATLPWATGSSHRLVRQRWLRLYALKGFVLQICRHGDGSRVPLYMPKSNSSSGIQIRASKSDLGAAPTFVGLVFYFYSNRSTYIWPLILIPVEDDRWDPLVIISFFSLCTGPRD